MIAWIDLRTQYSKGIMYREKQTNANTEIDISDLITLKKTRERYLYWGVRTRIGPWQN